MPEADSSTRLDAGIPVAPTGKPGAATRNATIQILPEAVASRIAAGEVVERPASVVKELVENALDAGARNLHVELEGGGRELVRVTDDGCGMGPQDLALCVLPHATSKLRSVEDLERLATLGFRGEALPSIAAVSRFALTSRLRADDAAGSSGWRVEVRGGEPRRPEPRPAGAPAGATVEVRDLFFNVPARAEFLKGAAAEAAACADALLRLALARPEVAFTLRQGRHEILALPAWPGAGSGAPQLGVFLRRARDVLGRSTSAGLLELDVAGPSDSPAGAAPAALPNDYRGYRLYGLISPPAITRPNRSSIYLAVNGRPVKDRTLTSALLESCRHLLPPQRYPSAVLFLELPGPDVDINVHPTKAEVRFRLPGLVYALFHYAMRSACGALPSAELSVQRAASSPGAPALEPAARGATAPVQRPLDLWPKSAALPCAATQYSAPSPQHVKSGRVGDEAAVFAPAAPSRAEPARQEPRARSPEPVPQPAALDAGAFRVLGQAGGAYIVLEDESGVKLIDQHALHERILFEELMARAEGRARGDAQGLLLAESLELTPVQAAVLAEGGAAEVLAELGFDAEAFGPRTVLVRAVPAVLKSAAAAGLVRDVLDALAAGADSTTSSSGLPSRASLREKAIYTLACQGAIKAGARLTLEQMTALVAAYRQKAGARGFTCPHGRPVAVELTWADLERGVGR